MYHNDSIKRSSYRKLENDFTSETLTSSSTHSSNSGSDTQGTIEPLNPNSSINTPTNNASLLSCAINLANTVAGAGMLGLPGAYAGSGIIPGTILLTTAALFSLNGLRLLSLSAEKVGIYPSSFYTVANAALPEFTIFIDFAVAIKCFGVATGYFITFGDCLVDAFHYFLNKPRGGADQSGGLDYDKWEDLLVSRHFWVFWGLLFVLPISFFRTLNALKFASILSLVLIYGLMAGIIMYASGFWEACEGFQPVSYDIGYAVQQQEVGDTNTISLEPFQTIQDEQCQGDIQLFTSVPETLKNLSIFVFAFTCHQNIFSVVNEISNRSQTRVDGVIILAIGSALMLYLTVAVEGYKTYGSNVSGDILLNYPQTGPVTVMRIGIALMVVLSYPLQLDPSRRCITSLVNSVQKRWGKKDNTSLRTNETATTLADETAATSHDNETCDMIPDNNSEDKLLLQTIKENFLFYGITCMFLVLSFIIAMLVSDLGIVLGIVGATGSTMVSYILPGAIYVKLHPQFHFLKLLAYIQLGLGVVIIPTALYFVIVYGGGE